MATTVVQARVDEELKRQAEELFELLGFDIPTVIRAVLKQSVADGRIPLRTSISPYPQEFVEKVSRGHQQYIEGDFTRYQDAEEALTDILGAGWDA